MSQVMSREQFMIHERGNGNPNKDLIDISICADLKLYIFDKSDSFENVVCAAREKYISCNNTLMMQ